DNIARLRARTLIRNGPATLHNVAAITRVNGDNETLLQPEFVFQYGRFLLQSEYTACWVEGVNSITNTPTQTNVKFANNKAYFSQAAYIEALYFLTPDHRAYSKRTGAFGRVVPHSNYFYVKGED